MSSNTTTPVKHKSISYAKWGYLFITPFFVVYILCSLVPLFSTFYSAFFEDYMDGLKHVGPTFVGFDNFVTLFTPKSSGSIDIIKFSSALHNSAIRYVEIIATTVAPKNAIYIILLFLTSKSTCLYIG